MYSMTGFGKGEGQGHHYEVTVEIKSVNHRFRDIRFRMSPLFNSIEREMSKTIEQSFKRGSFDIHVAYKKCQNHPTFDDDLDRQKIKDYLAFLKPICEARGVQLQVTAGEFLRPEFAANRNEEKEQELHQVAHQALLMAIEKLPACPPPGGHGPGGRLKATPTTVSKIFTRN